MDTPEIEDKWDLLACLIATAIITLFRIFESVLKIIFSILSILA